MIMKKLILTLAATAVVTAAVAQDREARLPVQRPERGSISTEIQFNPFDQGGHTFSLDGIKARFFFTDRDALRAKIGFGLTTDKFKTEFGDASYDKRRMGNVSVALGYERHFPVAQRIDLYVGGQFEFAKHFAKTKGRVGDQEFEIDNAAVEVSDLTDPFAALSEDNRGSSSFSFAVLGGMDIYIYRGLYLGTELGFDFSASRFDKVKFSAPGYPERQTGDTARKLDIGFYIEPTIRLGYTF